MMQLTLSGNGRVASYFKAAIDTHPQLELVGWYARKFEPKQITEASVWVHTPEELPQADIHLLCLADDALETIINRIHQKGVIAHTSGAVGLEVFNTDQQGGVFYPLQSFSKEIEISPKDIPICMEATSEEAMESLQKLSDLFGFPSQSMDSKQRLELHLAAVFANNFSNHCWTIAQQICQKAEINFDLLGPLLQQSFNKMQINGPLASQTGPAIRNDIQTLQKHLAQLPPELQEIYQILTTSIQKKHEL